jgi:hypothetical protein
MSRLLSRVEQSIPDATAGLVAIIACSSFLLSFVNLQAVAMEAGISPWLSWLWPLCIDALLVSGSLMILRSSLRGESAVTGWGVLLSFTAISTAFNMIHSPANFVDQAAHAIPPLALCVSIELLMIIIRSDLRSQESAPMQQDLSRGAQETSGTLPVSGDRAEDIKCYFALREPLGDLGILVVCEQMASGANEGVSIDLGIKTDEGDLFANAVPGGLERVTTGG